MKFSPMADRILVERKEAESMTAGGLIIPDQAKDKPQEGTVIEVGDGVEGKGSRLKPGDRILFGKYAGTEIRLNNRTYFIMREEEVFGIVISDGDEDVPTPEISERINESLGVVDQITKSTDSVLEAAHF